MPYTTVPSRSDGDVLTAAHLNILSANQEFLNGLANRANPPFNSFRKGGGSLTQAHMIWFGRHQNQYFHYNVESSPGADYIRIYWNDTKVAGDEGTPTSFAGYADLNDPSTWPNVTGSWAITTAYEDDLIGAGDDGEIVENDGAYYKCIVSHTSTADDEPGVGVNWEDFWVLLGAPVSGQLYTAYVDVNEGGAGVITVNYLIEIDATSI